MADGIHSIRSSRGAHRTVRAATVWPAVLTSTLAARSLWQRWTALRSSDFARSAQSVTLNLVGGGGASWIVDAGVSATGFIARGARAAMVWLASVNACIAAQSLWQRWSSLLPIGFAKPAHGAAHTPVGGAVKRLLDIAVSATALTLLLPLLVVIAALVRLTSPGPAIYAHRRVGFRGEAFGCFKFRTMVVNGDEVLREHLANNPHAAEEWARTRKLADDPRVTPLGRLLRMSSLDELPQFANVLIGHMSCVGPRPVVADELLRYGEFAQAYLITRPGITGLWQVSGRSQRTYEERVGLDRLYVRKWSMLLDALILLRTIPCVLRFDETS